MTRIDLLYFDAGGGHRSAAMALRESLARLEPAWQCNLVNLQEVLDPLDVLRKLTGIRIQDAYNTILRKGWTFGTDHLLKLLQAVVRFYHDEQVQLLRKFWSDSKPDLVVSLVPHFNRAIKESIEARTAFVTILTDIADYPPHFWIERQDQYFICGSERAVQQAQEAGIGEDKILRSSGMIIHPRFYDSASIEKPVDTAASGSRRRQAERQRLGLDPSLPTALVMFGGLGSSVMLEIFRKCDRAQLEIQFILICGRNQPLADRLRQMPSRIRRFVEGFTTEIPYYMSLADFFIGKPGPGSMSEALVMNLPLIVEGNSRTLPQERYNSQWVAEKRVGLVVRDFREIVPAIRQMLQPGVLEQFRGNAAGLRTRAVLEIPGMLRKILEQSGATQ